jgi:hypothetical protein
MLQVVMKVYAVASIFWYTVHKSHSQSCYFHHMPNKLLLCRGSAGLSSSNNNSSEKMLQLLRTVNSRDYLKKYAFFMKSL